MFDSRRIPCDLLGQNDISNAVWFEDAIRSYGVPTVLFDLHLVVPDIDEAAAVLRANDWTPEPPSMYSFLARTPASMFHRLLAPATGEEYDPDAWPPVPPGEEPPIARVAAVLFPAARWGVAAETLEQAVENDFVPHLPALTNALIGSYLDCPEDPNGGKVQSYLSCQLGYLYDYVPQLKEKTFTEELAFEHRQFHLDCLSKMRLWTIPFVTHERRIRKAIREGGYELRECSADTEETRYLFEDPLAQLHMERMAHSSDSWAMGE
ncbi:Uu.00g075440.m01.CDS01 [Anthostomella pinea]|uniref:Uu.00g075440.m01.CDS01 n=1 Tax=Anthostomella pinea TaxID=933095 RepID=A0AAI8VVN9_9PEZI|nr:Uu.00g075440.m01.CDS01 [Anthostomella pinea]